MAGCLNTRAWMGVRHPGRPAALSRASRKGLRHPTATRRRSNTASPARSVITTTQDTQTPKKAARAADFGGPARSSAPPHPRQKRKNPTRPAAPRQQLTERLVTGRVRARGVDAPKGIRRQAPKGAHEDDAGASPERRLRTAIVAPRSHPARRRPRLKNPARRQHRQHRRHRQHHRHRQHRQPIQQIQQTKSKARGNQANQPTPPQ